MSFLPFLNLIPQLPDFAGAGMNFAISGMQRNRYASQVRHLRRREYQDMMHSMKAAGLNPMLASGATPGHSAAYVGPSSTSLGGGAGVASAAAALQGAKASNRQAAVAEAKVPAEVAKLTTGRFLDAANVARVYYENGLIGANTAKIKAETDLALQQSGMAALQKQLLIQQAKREGASAKDLEAHYYLNLGDPRGIVGKELEEARDYDQATRGWKNIGDHLGKFLNSAVEAKNWLQEADNAKRMFYSGKPD